MIAGEQLVGKLEALLGALEATQKHLESHRTHDSRCPAKLGQGQRCKCGLEDARLLLLAAVQMTEGMLGVPQQDQGYQENLNREPA